MEPTMPLIVTEAVIEPLLVAALIAAFSAPFVIGKSSSKRDEVRRLFRNISEHLGYIIFGWMAFCLGGYVAPMLTAGSEGPMLLFTKPWSWLLPAALLYWAGIYIFYQYILTDDSD